jgi:hypothetical protein
VRNFVHQLRDFVAKIDEFWTIADSSNEEEWEKEFSNVPSSASSPTSPSKVTVLK